MSHGEEKENVDALVGGSDDEERAEEEEESESPDEEAEEGAGEENWIDIESTNVDFLPVISQMLGLSIEELVQSRLAKGQQHGKEEGKEATPAVLPEVTLEAVAQGIRDGTFKNIIVMTGAGISVAAGIPDFRSPGTGLYHNLQKYNLPDPQAIFELGFFKKNPKPFFTLAKELYPGNFCPTLAHYFIRLLHEKGVLLRNFTQNIDTLEREAGVPGEKLVEAHGSFAAAHCIDCEEVHEKEYVRESVFADQVPKCRTCNGLVKPDIVFFGENLPLRYFQQVKDDFPSCDLLIVIGTSLKVQPFASLIDKVTPTTPRLLINREAVGLAASSPSSSSMAALMALLSGQRAGGGFRFHMEDNVRDVFFEGDCQEGVVQLCRLIGWEDELHRLYAQTKQQQQPPSPSAAPSSSDSSSSPNAASTGAASESSSSSSSS